MGTVIRVSGCAVLVVAFAGCQSVLGLEGERHLADDAGTALTESETTYAAEAGADGDWTCLDTPIAAVTDATFGTTLTLRDAASIDGQVRFSGTPVAGASVKACARLDLDCASPLGATTSDGPGDASLTVPRGYDGYYEAVGAGFVPTLYATTRARADERFWVTLIKEEFIGLFTSIVGIEHDPATGMAVLLAEDCATRAASGVTFELSPVGGGSKLVYLVNTLPSITATSTDATGGAVMFDAPPGVLVVTAKLGGRTLRTMSTVIRSGWVTVIQVRADEATRWSP
jgi:hypothetical protein